MLLKTVSVFTGPLHIRCKAWGCAHAGVKRSVKNHRSRFKNGFWSEVKAAVKIKPEEYKMYFEDLIFAPNAEIGSKGVFKTASIS